MFHGGCEGCFMVGVRVCYGGCERCFMVGVRVCYGGCERFFMVGVRVVSWWVWKTGSTHVFKRHGHAL